MKFKENLNFELIKAQENDFQNIVLNLTSDFLVISKKNLEKMNISTSVGDEVVLHPL